MNNLIIKKCMYQIKIPKDNKRAAERNSGPIPKDQDGVGHVSRRRTLRHGKKAPTFGQRHRLGDGILHP